MPLSDQGVQNVKNIIDGVTSDPVSGVPGLVFISVDKAGKNLVAHASGVQGLNSKEPVTLDSTFWIASFTKLITSIAAMQLVEQGKLALDDPELVAKLAPEIKAKQVFADGVNGVQKEREVTLRQLLAHTAGFAYSFIDPRVAHVDEFACDESAMINSALVNQPGTMWEYGINLDWVGILVKRASGLSLEDYFQKNIFQPLGIKNITFHPSKEYQKRLVDLSQRGPDGKISHRGHGIISTPLNATSPDDFFHSGGGGLFATATDYAEILKVLLNDGISPTTNQRILSKETVDKMWENQIPEHPNFARGEAPPSPKPDLVNPSAGEMYPQEGQPPQGWGISFFLTIAPGSTGRGPNTAWWAGLANLYWWVDREKGVAGLIASQVLPFLDPKVIPAWFAAEKAVYDGLQ